ncbi:MAG: tyrosine-protein phosphatase [Dysgonamonadaceae bacterium]|nr:tyrosine-protein phosphatase [Dysgonamonadaceae bacterium]
MNNKTVVLFLFSLSVLESCVPDKPEIRTACEMDRTGDYLLKWETIPPLEGTVKIYESPDPDSFNIQSPVSEQSIKEGYKTVFAMYGKERTYFQLVFNKKYSVITAERIVRSDGIFNWRDIGGYYTQHKQQTKWGKLFRSSSLARSTTLDIETMKVLNVKTVIDLRTDEENYTIPSTYRAYQTFNLPLESTNPFSFFNKVISEEMKKGDIIIKLQDIQMELLHNNTNQFIKIFDILLNKDNYPIVIYCTLGNERTGLMTALLLSALEVPYDQIVRDYMLSNDYINFNQIVPDAAERYSTDVQEALTTLFSSHEQVVNYFFDQIVKEHESVANYLEKELKLTNKKREKLKEILLYPANH